MTTILKSQSKIILFGITLGLIFTFCLVFPRKAAAAFPQTDPLFSTVQPDPNAPSCIPAIYISKQAKGPDTRIFASGTDIPFNILVKNTGGVLLTNVVVSDTLVSACSLNIGSLAAGATNTYTCTALNVTKGFTNVAAVTGTNGCVTVKDQDPSTVKIASIDIRKQAEGPDSRTFASGSNVPFEIAVTNTGEVPLTDVVISDTLVPGCTNTFASLAAGETKTYSCTAVNVTKGFTNIASVTGKADQVTVSDEDPSTVQIADIDISKQAEGPDSRTFTSGSDIDFEITVTNTGEVDLTEVVVTDELVPGCAKTIGSLAVGETQSYTCTIKNVTEGFTNVAKVTGKSDEVVVSDEDPSTVLVASIYLRKQEKGPDSRNFASGSDVDFEIEVKNTGEADLTDVEVTDAEVPGCAKTIGDLAAGETTTYTCTASHVKAGFTNTATVEGHSGEITVTDSDTSTVVVNVYHYYIPFASFSGDVSNSTKFSISVGYEDLRLDQPNDFDYNDWIASMVTLLTYNQGSGSQIDLKSILFHITPKARGATLNHEFHVQFPANTFGGNGTATLTIRDGNGNVVSSNTIPIVGSQAVDFTIFADDYLALPPQGVGVNTTEGTGPEPAALIADLAFTFPQPVLFTLADYGTHGNGLFFNPYIRVKPAHASAYDVGIGDVRTLVVPTPTWKWPEEGIRIDKVYTLVNLSLDLFPANWWTYYNVCVYGDGVFCPLADIQKNAK